VAFSYTGNIRYKLVAFGRSVFNMVFTWNIFSLVVLKKIGGFMNFLKSTFASYLGMLLACAAIALGVVKVEYAGIAWMIAGFLGYGSIAVLRSKIDSEGWKTYAIFIVTCVLALLQIFGVITPELFDSLMIAFAPLTGITLQQALAKSVTSTVPKIGKAQ
jgi:hypothetical protein